jgi:heat-inducible transcriptional repressor
MTPKTDRKDRILDAIVRLYSSSGQPVSSALVTRALVDSVSPATVRAEMKRLEDEGLLAQPHTSAGRVPTDIGFRSFVNRMLVTWPDRNLQLADLHPMVTRELSHVSGAPTMIKSLAALLCRLTDNIGIILGPAWDNIRAQRLDIYPKESRRILMVLVLENALVRTGSIVLDADYNPEILADAARLLSERIAGKTISEIRGGVLDSLDAGGGAADACAVELAQSGNDIFSDVEDGDLELMGVANVLDEPEFSDPVRLKNLVKFLESPRSIREALKRLSPENEEGIAIWIGSENPIDELQPFSLVSSPYELGERKGVLAVLGLRRMSYDKTVAGMRMLIEGMKHLN